MGSKARALRRRRISDGIWFAVTTPLCLLILLLVRVLRPVWLVRFGQVGYRAEKIGHFVFDVALAHAEACERRERGVRQSDFYFYEGRPGHHRINTAWEGVTRDHLRVSPLVKFLACWNRIIPGGTRHERAINPLALDRDGLIQKHPLTLPPVLQETGVRWMESRGWAPDEPVVCLHVRDNAFHRNAPDGQAAMRSGDIADFLSLVQALTVLGVWVVRTGRIAEHRAPFQHERFIDYAFDPDRNDALDVWLFANSALTVTTGSGPDMISSVLGRPVVYVNALGLGLPWWSDCEYLPRRLLWKLSGEELSLAEFVRCSEKLPAKPMSPSIIVQPSGQDEMRDAALVRLGLMSDAFDQSAMRSARKEFFNELRKLDWFIDEYPYVHPNAGPSARWALSSDTSSPLGGLSE